MQLLVHKLIHVDVVRVMVGAGRVGPVHGIHGVLEELDVIPNPVGLHDADAAGLGFMEFKCLPGMPRATRGKERCVARTVLVFLEDVAAGDGWLVGVGRSEFLDVHTVLALLDTLEEHHHAVIIAGVSELAAIRVHEHLHQPAPAGIVSHVFPQFVAEEVVHQAFVGVGIAENPVGLGGQAEERRARVVAQLIL